MPATPAPRAGSPAEGADGGPDPDGVSEGAVVTEPTRSGRGRALGWRLLLAVATLVAVVVLVRRLEAVDLGHRLRTAKPGWVLVSIGLSMLPIIGSTVALIALTPGRRLPYWRTTAVQLAT